MRVTTDAKIIDFLQSYILRNISTADGAPINAVVRNFALARYLNNDTIFWKGLDGVTLTDFQVSLLIVALDKEYNTAIRALKLFYNDTSGFVADGDELWCEACTSLSCTI